MSAIRVDHEQGATFVELFFDLVFVYAVTQLTAAVLHDLTWSGVGRHAILFWLVWWAWTQFTWTLNLADTEHVLVRVPTLAATAVLFFLAQSVSDAYGDAGAWFAVSYALSRVIGIAVQTYAVRGTTPQSDAALITFTGASLAGIVLVLAGGFVDGDLRLVLWGLAIVADLVTVYFAGRGVWELAAGHFAERHGLIVIIALGESLIAAGVATAELTRDATFAFTTAGAVVAACALWWLYFGVLQPAFEHRLANTRQEDVGRFGRDVFSLSHAAIVGGVIGIAVGFEEAIAHPEEPLEAAAALALTFGVALFVGGMAVAAARAGIVTAVRGRLLLAALVVATTFVIPEVQPAVTLWGLAALVTVVAVREWRVEHAGTVI